MKYKEIVLQHHKKYGHRLERHLYYLAVVVNVLVYIFIGYALWLGKFNEKMLSFIRDITGFSKDNLQLLIKISDYIIIILLLYIILGIIYYNGNYLGKVLKSETRLKDSRFKELNTFCVECMKKLELPEVITVMISDKDIKSDIFGVKIRSEYVITISKSLLFTCEKNNDYTPIEFDIVRKLSNIALGYNDLENYLATFWAYIIPILNFYLYRNRAYSVIALASSIYDKDKCIKCIAYGDGYFTLYNKDDMNKENLEHKLSYNKIEYRSIKFDDIFSPLPSPKEQIDYINSFYKNENNGG